MPRCVAPETCSLRRYFSASTFSWPCSIRCPAAEPSPLGLCSDAAAQYVGIGTTIFDEMVRDDVMLAQTHQVSQAVGPVGARGSGRRPAVGWRPEREQ